MLYTEDFLSGKIAVNCQTEEEVTEFFRWCREEHDITWLSGNTLDNTRWGEYRHNKRNQIAYIYIEREGFPRGLLYHGVAYYRRFGTNVVCYSELFLNEQDSDFEPASDEEFKAFLSTVSYKM
jgi:hypothetical protein